MCGLGFIGLVLALFYTLVVALLSAWLGWRGLKALARRLGGRGYPSA
jgi:uncharacterized membrane protein YbaN (DUF454 family)